jgi:uncharacterized protein (UPF0335 family)
MDIVGFVLDQLREMKMNDFAVRNVRRIIKTWRRNNENLKETDNSFRLYRF